MNAHTITTTIIMFYWTRTQCHRQSL